ncbi:hypothetical protein SDC9_80346 [bioreactor metagenome]|uniref:Uncharacterized protein n=1 Tax=bioreactor metagenome TaxID=1076179 RepID=A0A644YZH9_9ZZZZ
MVGALERSQDLICGPGKMVSTGTQQPKTTGDHHISVRSSKVRLQAGLSQQFAARTDDHEAMVFLQR